MGDLISVEEARGRVLKSVSPLAEIDVPIADARGTVVSIDLKAPHDLPRFDNSAMDGFALRSEDAARVPAELEVVGEVRAGDAGDVKVERGTAARIMTGAPMPPGSDAVCPIEQATERDGRVTINAATTAGSSVRAAGEDVRAGDVLVEAGTELGSAEMALLASMGISPVPVRKTPRVAVVVTGDELVEPEADVRPGAIHDSNTSALRALVEEAGAVAVVMDRAADVLDEVVSVLDRASEIADLVVSSGGVSVGKHDHVKSAVEKLGAIDAWRVAMRPGKPVVIGNVRGVPFLGLPGNPVSVHVSFEQFARPAIRKMRGCRSLLRPTLRARLSHPLDKAPGRMELVRVRLEQRDNEWIASPTGPQGSHIQTSLVGAHGVARFGIDESHLDAATEVVVEVWRLPEPIDV
ncbi:MAG: molybdopterin molybdotransferase MoeA [Actinomycetota bacterium]|nr:molybdopterin molybdotransferase MoeA [Actinomycetota bacterium]